MNFKELKSWSKKYGYEVLKSKGTEECLWSKIDDPAVTGICDTLSETARAIYNDITDNRWVEYQEQYKREKQMEFRF